MTTLNRLKSLQMSAFRGASEPFSLTFDIRKNLTVIYGENGSGKTTICDALVFLAEGEVGSLKERGLGSSLQQYWPSLGKDLQQIEVTLETEKGSYTGRINKTKTIITPIERRPKIVILRRDLMSTLTESTPSDRYQAISRFVDVSGFEKSEAGLIKLKAELAQEDNRLAEAEGRSLDLLQSFMKGDSLTQGANPVEWARAAVLAAQSDHSDEIRALDKLLQFFDQSWPLPQRSSGVAESIRLAREAFSNAEQALAEASDGADFAATDLVALLEMGRNFLLAHSAPDICPLCESPDRAAGLPASIEVRLEQLRTLRQAIADRNDAAKRVERADQEARILAEHYQSMVRDYSQVVNGHQWPEGMSKPPLMPGEVSEISSWLEAHELQARAWRELRDRFVGQRDSARNLNAALSQYEDSDKKRSDLRRLAPAVAAAQNICREQRQTFVDEIISEIALEVRRLYSSIHPDEGMGEVTFAFDPNKKSSLDLFMGYGDNMVPPQAYFSQSHLDTLGLCITIALALRERPGETILVLDDVLGSVDEPHVQRVIHMIYEESVKFRHTIVTTHYGPWKFRHRWGQLAAGHLQFVELARWDKGAGMRLGKALPELARLERYLVEEDLDYQAICGKTGVILEACLDFLTRKYQCKLPRKPAEDFSIYEMLDSIGKELRVSLRAEIRTNNSAAFSELLLGPILERLKAISHVRNLTGAHFNELSANLLGEDTILFAGAVKQLAEALCHGEDGWPDKDDSGSYWRNTGDTRRLHPLRKPN